MKRSAQIFRSPANSHQKGTIIFCTDKQLWSIFSKCCSKSMLKIIIEYRYHPSTQDEIVLSWLFCSCLFVCLLYICVFGSLLYIYIYLKRNQICIRIHCEYADRPTNVNDDFYLLLPTIYIYSEGSCFVLYIFCIMVLHGVPNIKCLVCCCGYFGGVCICVWYLTTHCWLV